jgi:hypothetical protein
MDFMTAGLKSLKQIIIDRMARIIAPMVADALLPVLTERVSGLVDARINGGARPLLPPVDVFRSSPDAPFMAYSTCTATDFLHPEFQRLTNLINHQVFYHRKLWEFIFILHHAFRLGAVGPDKRALGFGVGTEPLPAAFAGAGTDIVATDAPPEIGLKNGWADHRQLAEALSAIPEGRMPRAEFERRVRFEPCDMNAISTSLTGFDFCWSACALEHLGSIEKGLDFIINSVEKTLKIGGVAVHTTEFNLSSNSETLDNNWTVLFRRRDLDQLVEKLRERGHHVEPFTVAPDTMPVDRYIDMPPYGEPHLKLLLENFVTTSAGLVIRRGR